MASRPLILCVGDIDVDLMIAVPQVPGPDEKVNGRRLSLSAGGMMANAAVALARLGSPVRLLGAVGDDRDGAFAVQVVADEGVDVRFVTRRPGVPTFMCVVMVGPTGEKSLVRVASEAYLPKPSEITPAAFEGVGHLHLTLGSPRLTDASLSAAAARGVPSSLDLEAADIPDEPAVLAAILDRVDYLFMSRTGARAARARLGHMPRGRAVYRYDPGCRRCHGRDWRAERGSAGFPHHTRRHHGRRRRLRGRFPPRPLWWRGHRCRARLRQCGRRPVDAEGRGTVGLAR